MSGQSQSKVGQEPATNAARYPYGQKVKGVAKRWGRKGGVVC